ncbi:MAG: malonyl-CoA synthase [Rhodospirillales bacterium]|nr:malonyl-CoA synthase [Rhodospirillales bacterium]
MNANLYALFQSRFPTDISAPFIEMEDGRRISYGDMDEGSARLAGLLGELGVGRGDRVAVQVEKSPEAVLLYLACLRAGAVYLPLNTAYTSDEVGYFLGDAEPSLLVCAPSDKERLHPVAEAAGVAQVRTLGGDGRGSLTAEMAKAEPDHSVAEMAGDDLAAILYTSGTTGRSKGAMLTHDNLSSNGLALHRIWGWRPGDVLLHALPIFHVHGLFVAIHCAMLNGSPMLFLPKFDAGAVMRLLPKATVLMGVPTFYVRLVDQPALTKEYCKRMRLFISGSAPLLEETFTAFESRTGHRILERYGMTEAGMITSNPLDGDRLPGTVGHALPDVSVRVADENGKPVAAGEIGVLEITGPNVFKGYWRMPEKTAEEFRADGWFITGDMARMDTDGRVAIVGRAKDLIISGGFNVYPKEVELAVDDVPGIGESAVIGVSHPDFGEAVVAVATREGGASDIDEEAVIAHLRDRLARFKQPKKVVFVDELPRNTMGKVQKNVLREEYANLFRD